MDGKGTLFSTARSAVSYAANRRRLRPLLKGLRTRTVPPPPRAFGSFGDSYIVAPARVDSPQYIFIGDGVVLHEGIWLSVVKAFDDVDPHLEIRDRTIFGRFCQISCVGEIVIEEDVLVSDQVQIGDTYHEYADPSLPSTKQPLARPQSVRVKRGSLVGLGAIVLPGITVGEGAYVQEGSVVTADVPDGAVVSGNPAKIVAYRGAST
jgi:acetyltransferase-like isoleucine patch superfamily enzyme